MAATGDATVHDLDDQGQFQHCLSRLKETSTHNFTVNFGSDHASCEINITSQDVVAKLESGTQQSCGWFNFWGWSEDHEAAIFAIARKYEVSPRLTNLLCPRKQPPRPASQGKKTPDATETKSAALCEAFDQLEKAEGRPLRTHLDLPSAGQQAPKRQISSLADVVDDLWHFSSVDWGRHYVCIGTNSLFSLPGRKNPDTNRPNAERIWSTLLLCDDGTVVSCFEAPPTLDKEVLKVVRKNQLNVVVHLSQVHLQSSSHENTLMQVSIRPLNTNPDDAMPTSFNAAHAASLLFYYLFDDWMTTYGLISGREHPYRDSLESLRQKMSFAPEVDDVAALHQLGRQLTVLKRVYQSYESVVNQILQRQRLLSGSNQNQPHLTRTDTTQSQHSSRFPPAASLPTQIYTEPSPLHTADTLPIATPALARFERLHSRITLYALTEISSCLEEKESLVLMNFNLINLRNASAIEALTRTTILLAKATILFLPVSLMTGYFSTTLHGVQGYGVGTYWVAFAVVVVVTGLGLWWWGWAWRRVGGRVVYRGVLGGLWERKKRGRRGEGEGGLRGA